MRHKGIYLLKKGEKELKYTWGGCKIAGGFNLLRSVEDIETYTAALGGLNGR